MFFIYTQRHIFASIFFVPQLALPLRPLLQLHAVFCLPQLDPLVPPKDTPTLRLDSPIFFTNELIKLRTGPSFSVVTSLVLLSASTCRMRFSSSTNFRAVATSASTQIGYLFLNEKMNLFCLTRKASKLRSLISLPQVVALTSRPSRTSSNRRLFLFTLHGRRISSHA